MDASILRFENEYLEKGYKCIAGVDEVGMGCLAGPVVASAVILDLKKIPEGITDSKKLTAKKREVLSEQIQETALGFAIASATVEEIDTINIYHAAKLAMKRAVEKLKPAADFLLIDGRGKIESAIPQIAIVKGDFLSVSIGAASILAKVFRDNLMRDMDTKFPGYGFASHKGYGSVVHRKALQEKGTTPHHRKSFSWTPVWRADWEVSGKAGLGDPGLQY